MVYSEEWNNADLLTNLTGKTAADSLLQKFGGLTQLAQASFDELTTIKGIGQSKARAIKSAFLLAQRLSRESYREAPLLDEPQKVADLLREQTRLYESRAFPCAPTEHATATHSCRADCQGNARQRVSPAS